MEKKRKRKHFLPGIYIHVLTHRFDPLAPRDRFTLSHTLITCTNERKKFKFNCTVFTLLRYKNTNKKHTYRQGPPNDSPP